MKPLLPMSAELADLLESLCLGELSTAEAHRLDELVRSDDECCRHYVVFMQMHALAERFDGVNNEVEAKRLESSLRSGDCPDFCLSRAPTGTMRSMADWSGAVPFIARDYPDFRLSLAPTGTMRSMVDWPETVPFMATPFGNSMRYLSSHPLPLSYVVATVLFGIALLIGSLVRVSHYQPQPGREGTESIGQIAGNLPRIQPGPRVGRITGLVDCRWTDPAVEVVEGDDVRLNRTYGLAAGFLEITYDTGAKVILQGPCTYEVESAASGYLSIGKLTALVETKTQAPRPYVGSAVKLPNQRVATGSKGERTANLALSQPEREPTTSLALRPLAGKSEVRNPKSESVDPSPLATRHSPLFSVRTPTAVVTDLGTEFGVEVNRSGTTSSHVFQGRVQVRPVVEGNDGSKGIERPVLLTANESATIEAGEQSVIKVDRGTSPSVASAFVRRMPSSVILHHSPLATRHSPAYRLTDLGTLGGPTSQAETINGVGEVAGETTDVAGVEHAFLYCNGKMKDIGAACRVCDINASGQVVGVSGANQSRRAFLYSDGRMKHLGTLGGAWSCANGINDTGQVVGKSSNSDGVERAFLYSPGEGMKDLGALGGAKAESQALAINASGLVTGHSKTKDGQMHAFLVGAGVGMKDLGTLGGTCSLAHRLNAAGQVIGCSTIGNSVEHAFIYSDRTGMKGLDILGSPKSFALYINNTGQVVGGIAAGGGAARFHAFLYSGGKMIDLNSLLAPSSGWVLGVATAINDLGQIVGSGVAPHGSSRAFLLTPLSKPEATP